MSARTSLAALAAKQPMDLFTVNGTTLGTDEAGSFIDQANAVAACLATALSNEHRVNDLLAAGAADAIGTLTWLAQYADARHQGRAEQGHAPSPFRAAEARWRVAYDRLHRTSETDRIAMRREEMAYAEAVSDLESVAPADWQEFTDALAWASEQGTCAPRQELVAKLLGHANRLTGRAAA